MKKSIAIISTLLIVLVSALWTEITRDEKICKAFRYHNETGDSSLLVKRLKGRTKFRCGNEIITFKRTKLPSGEILGEFDYKKVREDIGKFRGTEGKKKIEIARRLEKDLIEAIREDDIARAKNLVSKGAQIHRHGNGSPMQLSIRKNAYKILRYILSRGVKVPDDPNAQAKLLFEIKSDKLARMLIDNGMKLGIKKYDGSSFLSHMAKYALLKTEKYAFGHYKYDINEKDKYGNNILVQACGSIFDGKKTVPQIEKMLAFLLSKGANDNEGHDNPNIISPILACQEGVSV